MAHILLVEDDSFLRKGLTELFEREGYQVTTAASVSDANCQLHRSAPDLVVLDVTLPDGNGVELCQRWRAEGITLPILFLTARDEEYEIVQGLDAGGNDYVTKPFRMQELLSRLRVLLRGVSNSASTHRTGFDIDETKMTVTMDGKPLTLTPTEYKMLILLAKKSSVITRDMLLEVLWDDGGKYVDDNTLSVHMSRLREKVGAQHIKTIRGVGYQWQD